MFSETVSYHIAFLAGLLSFFSPCILPLIPAYFTLITGFSLEDLMEKENRRTRKKVFLSTIAFVLGFSFVFILLGSSATYLGVFISKYTHIIRIIGGIIIIILGVHLSGLVRISGLDFEKRIQIKKKPVHFLGTFAIGMAFGSGWTPCIGPLLGSILILASNQETVNQGMILLSFYAAGMAIPFIIISILINSLLVFIKKASGILKYVNAVSGVLLILVGLFLVSSRFLF
jgi:cytochrome c-type biogenesis protein